MIHWQQISAVARLETKVYWVKQTCSFQYCLLVSCEITRNALVLNYLSVEGFS